MQVRASRSAKEMQNNEETPIGVLLINADTGKE
jgi:hypothetical protein